MLLFNHLVYLAALTALVLLLPAEALSPEEAQFVFVIGIIGIWRYSWGATHWVRFLIYRHIVFPRWRARCEALGPSGRPSYLYLLITSFRIDAETTRRVYDAAIREAIRYGSPATIVASIVERGDQTFIKQLFVAQNPPAHLKLVFVRVAGTGKRDALACGFRAISKAAGPPGAIAAVIDGDSMLAPGLLERCCPIFALFPKVGALTTDEVCVVEGKRVFREWYNMRFAQRHVLMGSVGLSRHVLTLTGRMSMFRADIVTHPDFVDQIELDWIDHWRLGRIRFLTGDDKSSWFYLLRNRWQMLYVPDAQVLTVETPPDPAFISSSLQLMRRWFGNMLRTNARAAALGPRSMGLFTWWCIVDQRLSMWTSLAGLTAAFLGTLVVNPFAFFYYLIWIAFTRYLLTLSLLAARPRVSAVYPFLLYYNQIVGSFVKIFVIFRLNKQKWTRQKTTLGNTPIGLKYKMAEYGSLYSHACALILFATAIATAAGILPVPDPGLWSTYLLGMKV